MKRTIIAAATAFLLLSACDNINDPIIEHHDHVAYLRIEGYGEATELIGTGRFIAQDEVEFETISDTTENHFFPLAGYWVSPDGEGATEKMLPRKPGSTSTYTSTRLRTYDHTPSVTVTQIHMTFSDDHSVLEELHIRHEVYDGTPGKEDEHRFIYILKFENLPRISTDENHMHTYRFTRVNAPNCTGSYTHILATDQDEEGRYQLREESDPAITSAAILVQFRLE